MMYLMHHIYEKEILPYIEEIGEIIKIIAKEDRNYLEDVVYYILEKGNARSEKEVISKIQEIVPKELNIMGTIAEKLIEKGKLEGKLEVAKRMLEEGIEIKTISAITGIGIEEINKFRN